jgi:immunity protein, SdpI family
MPTTWKRELPQLVVVAGLFMTAALSWSHAPDRIPVHWNVAGEVDRYGGKFEGLLLVPLMALGLYLLLLFLPRLDPGYVNYQKFATPYLVIRWSLLVFLSVIYGATLMSAFGRPVDIGAIVPCAVGLLFIVLGNFMGKIRPNWFVGVRTPWTLSSKLSWAKTHRLAGRLFVVMGLLFFVLAFVHKTWLVATLISVMVGCVVWMVVYSYLIWRNDPDRVPPAGTTTSGEPG